MYVLWGQMPPKINVPLSWVCSCRQTVPALTRVFTPCPHNSPGEQIQPSVLQVKKMTPGEFHTTSELAFQPRSDFKTFALPTLPCCFSSLWKTSPFKKSCSNKHCVRLSLEEHEDTYKTHQKKCMSNFFGFLKSLFIPFGRGCFFFPYKYLQQFWIPQNHT